MRIANSSNYSEVPFEITTQDLAIIFDDLNLGIRMQMNIVGDIWDNEKWIIQRVYRSSGKRKSFIQGVLYQIDYLYHKTEIDNSLKEINENAKEVGYNIEIAELIEDYEQISTYFKKMWIQLKYLSKTGYTRAKLRTILKQYGYKRRSTKFCDYFLKCLNHYGIYPYVKGEICDIRTVSLNEMITFKILWKKN